MNGDPMKVLLFVVVLVVSSASFAAQLSFRGTVKGIQKCSWDSSRMVSEHSPNFMCATTEEFAGTSGISHSYEVVFAASRDVAWFQFPKLKGGEVGQFTVTSAIVEGHWVLTKFIEDVQDLPHPPPPPVVSFMCVHQGSNYYSITNADTGKAYGSSVYGLEACKNSLPKPGVAYACVHQGSNYYSLANLVLDKTFGSSVYGLASCQAALPAPGKKFACVHQGSNYWSGMNLQTGVTLGSSVYGLEACKAQLP
jgi:hypothetical protein